MAKSTPPATATAVLTLSRFWIDEQGQEQEEQVFQSTAPGVDEDLFEELTLRAWNVLDIVPPAPLRTLAFPVEMLGGIVSYSPACDAPGCSQGSLRGGEPCSVCHGSGIEPKDFTALFQPHPTPPPL